MKKLHVALVRGSSQSSGGGYDYETKLATLFDEVCSKLDVRLTHWFCDQTSGLRQLGNLQSTLVATDKKSRTRRAGLHPTWRFRTHDGLIDDKLEEQEVSLVCFASPNSAALKVTRTPLVTTIWDLGHRDLPEFPEFRGSTWKKREHYFGSTLPRSHHVFTDSLATGRRIEHLYGVIPERWSALGLLVAPERGRTTLPPKVKEVPTARYVIYPAKRWPHKNHLELLEAFRKVVDQIPDAKLVLTGGYEGGSQELIADRVRQLGLDSNVLDFGYVGEETLLSLMANSSAVVMPSKLGPTNIPPLMALALGVPAIVSNAHKFDPEVQSRLQVVSSDTRAEWAEKIASSLQGKVKSQPFNLGLGKPTAQIQDVIQKFDASRQNW